ncbi:hypothetical protein KZZ52_30400 [Dactylosporangium sp. AC04546]|uniref:hypothetical protein n=1 Tax=Dactylosporangium sp. AC04546 TaxID=2862460 RepID=UPI001EE1142B|nr:hypothetical protein [Dactylosporangium sp. AC04546]WVK78308.1 hypothetical protein KZZ52_30400 [Dactylosporangium sp. AC04546]
MGQPLVDLDTPPAPPRRRMPRWLPWLAALLLVGALVLARPDDRPPSIAVVVDAGQLGPIAATYDAGTVRIESQLTVVNSGAVPVELEDLAAEAEGLTVHADGGPRSLGPGRAVVVGVRVQLSCGTVPLTPVRFHLTVRTADGRRSVVEPLVAIADTPWTAVAGAACPH